MCISIATRFDKYTSFLEKWQNQPSLWNMTNSPSHHIQSLKKKKVVV